MSPVRKPEGNFSALYNGELWIWSKNRKPIEHIPPYVLTQYPSTAVTLFLLDHSLDHVA